MKGAKDIEAREEVKEHDKCLTMHVYLCPYYKTHCGHIIMHHISTLILYTHHSTTVLLAKHLHHQMMILWH